MMKVTTKLLKWYDANRRDLPWRRTRDPYAVWVSEVILQQTRVDQGLDYYLRFLERFPGIRSLAEADPDDVLRVWQGLGYYSRARNMQEAARQMMDQHGGHFPGTYHSILSLKGIGPYTAAAIASICFSEATPVVDGNVLRFISRLHGIRDPVDSLLTRNRIAGIAGKMMEPGRPGDFNQAMMEFGALWCKPVNPGCGSCIFRRECVAYREGAVGEIPLKAKAKQSSGRYFNYLVVRLRQNGNEVLFLRRREKDDIWKGLYEFPLIETDKPVSLKSLMKAEEWEMLFKGTGAVAVKEGKTVKHVLSHRVIHARFHIVFVNKPLKGQFVRISMGELDQFPVPKLIAKFLNTVTR